MGSRTARGLAPLIAAAALAAGGCGGSHKAAAVAAASAAAAVSTTPAAGAATASPTPGVAPATPAPSAAPAAPAAATAAPAAAATPAATLSGAPTPTPTDSTGPPPIPPAIVLTSSAFKNGQAIPAAYTCAGRGRIPTLVYDGVPESSELMLTVVDRDAPKHPFVHWLVYGMPAASTQGTVDAARLPPGTLFGKNSAGKVGWTPPCPPKGSPAHHYVFTLYSIGSPTGLKRGVNAKAVQKMVDAGAVALGRLTGTFARR